MKFLDGLDDDIKRSLLAQLRNLWTHSSTALEGNTLTLGETAFVLEEGLTVSGKPLKDHEDVAGHASAIEMLYNVILLNEGITEVDVFDFHKAILKDNIRDIYKPIGARKIEQNGTYAVTRVGNQAEKQIEKQVYIEYAAPQDVPVLMKRWLVYLNQSCSVSMNKAESLAAYAKLHMAFVRIHPFFDGNGRLARLLSNIPVVKAGFPPVTIAKEKRRAYIQLLSQYELAVGQPKSSEDLLPENEWLNNFQLYCEDCWQAAWLLIDEAHLLMKTR